MGRGESKRLAMYFLILSIFFAFEGGMQGGSTRGEVREVGAIRIRGGLHVVSTEERSHSMLQLVMLLQVSRSPPPPPPLWTRLCLMHL